MGGLFNSLLVIVVIAVILTGIVMLVEYFENRKIKFVLNRIEKISKKTNNKKLESCINAITENKMKN